MANVFMGPGENFQAGALPPLKAPVETDRSFFVGGKPVAWVDPERMVPTEEVLPGVHVPLPLLPNVPCHRWDEDHARFESNDPRLIGWTKRPLRYCYVQFLPRAVHDRKNELFDAVEIPTEPEKIFQAVLLGAARYIPHRAVDVSGQTPKIVTLTDAMRTEFHRKGWIRMQRNTKWRIGLYLATHILANGIEAVRDTEEMARFLEAADPQARAYASFDVIREAVKTVVDPFEPVYERARRQGLIRRPEPRAGRFVTQYFDRHQPDYVPTILERLGEAA